MKIEGRNAVTEAVKAGTTIDRLVVQKGLKDASAQNIIDAAKSRGIKIFFRDKEALDRESVTGRHQGFIAEITDYKYCELEDEYDQVADEAVCCRLFAACKRCVERNRFVRAFYRYSQSL